MRGSICEVVGLIVGLERWPRDVRRASCLFYVQPEPRCTFGRRNSAEAVLLEAENGIAGDKKVFAV